MWIEIKGYEGQYRINEDGIVLNIATGKFKSIHLNPQGYKMVTLCKNNQSKVFLLHRLIASSFIPNPRNYKCVNHIDGNKQNNQLINLEWCNHSRNNQHAYDIGLKSGTVKPIIQYDKNMKIVNRFSSITEAGKIYNLSCISRCLSKTHLKHSGFYWRYA